MESMKSDNRQALPVMLILVGLPGSGKSTFSSMLVNKSSESSSNNWVRINQDSVRDGGRGTKEECLAAAEIALNENKSVIIDRTNCTSEQRKDFVNLAKTLGMSDRIHCIFFDLPTKECGFRASKRVQHEGGVQDKGAYGIVGRMAKELQESGPPNADREGFKSLLICRNDVEIDAAFEVWSIYHDFQFSSKEMSNFEGQEYNVKKDWDKRVSSKLGKVEDPSVSNSTNAFQIMMGAAAAEAAVRKRRKTVESKNEKSLINNNQSTALQGVHMSRHGHLFQKPTPFLDALQNIADHPERYSASVVLEVQKDYIIMLDKYPKARHHALVVSRNRSLQGPLDLTSEDIPLLKEMKTAAQIWSSKTAPLSSFALGFHSIPSMRRLHLHVISKDFESPYLKTKKHWNSFCSQFFLDIDWVLEQLSISNGSEASVLGTGSYFSHDDAYDTQRVTNSKEHLHHTSRRLEYDFQEMESFLRGPLRCHACDAEFRSILALKNHLKSCTSYHETYLENS